jgi:hypothetical protein
MEQAKAIAASWARSYIARSFGRVHGWWRF